MPIDRVSFKSRAQAFLYSFFVGCLGLTLVFLAGCGSKKSEADQLAEMRDSLVYTHYKGLTEPGLKPAMTVLLRAAATQKNVQVPDLTAVDYCLIRVFLSFSAIKAGKNSVGLAEADLVDSLGCPQVTKDMAASLRSVIFMREEWPGLASQEVAPLRSRGFGEAGTTNAQKGTTDLVVFHVAMAYVAATEKRPEDLRFHGDALSVLLNQPWLKQAVGAAINLQTGDLAAALVQMKALSNDPTVPAELRGELALIIKGVEQQVGDVDAPALQLRIMAAALAAVVEAHGPTALVAAKRYLDAIKLPDVTEDVKNLSTSTQKAVSGWFD